uniref:Uncharacterized protein n=1 Tax=Cucumis sativus TaxID=3659 RepID=A0A0A0KYG5_CUCSA
MILKCLPFIFLPFLLHSQTLATRFLVAIEQLYSSKTAASHPPHSKLVKSRVSYQSQVKMDVDASTSKRLCSGKPLVVIPSSLQPSDEVEANCKVHRPEPIFFVVSHLHGNLVCTASSTSHFFTIKPHISQSHVCKQPESVLFYKPCTRIDCPYRAIPCFEPLLSEERDFPIESPH